MNRWLLIGASVVLILLAVRSGRVLYFYGPYPGRVVDLKTTHPLEGAAVLAIWWKEAPGLGHPIHSEYEVQETLTDQHGNFTIPGIVGGSLNPLVKIREPIFIIFKPGHAAYSGLVFKPISLPENIERFKQGHRTVFALGRLTSREETLRNLGSVSVSSRFPKDKYPHLMRLKNIERVNLGLEPLRIQKGKRQ